MTTTSSIPGFVRLVVLLSVVAVFVAAHTAESQGTVVRLEVPSESLKVDGEAFSVDVIVNDVANLGSFQLALTYDPGVIEFQDVKEGPFLGSSGRRVECLPPDTTAGSVGFLCVTLGATPDGPSGSGVLATLTFQPVGAGTSPLHFSILVLTDPPASRLPADTEDASVRVEQPGGGGIRWALWGPVIGGIAAVLVVAGAGAWYARRRWLRQRSTTP
jgi:hypothetical protein